MNLIPVSIYKIYKPNSEISKAIKERLAQLLYTDRPEEMVALMTQRRLNEFPGKGYSSVEDQVIQSLILQYKDDTLDRLWLLYNAGYFKHDTERFVELCPMVHFEDFYKNVQICFEALLKNKS